MKVYIAGELFDEASIAQRLKEGEMLKEGGIDYYNPIENDEINDKSKIPSAKDIFYGDFEEVLKSTHILADIQSMDPGVIMELGIAIGLNYAKNNDISNIPEKKIIAHNSDIRFKTANRYNNFYVPVGTNQFVIGGIEEYGSISDSSKVAIEEIKKDK